MHEVVSSDVLAFLILTFNTQKTQHQQKNNWPSWHSRGFQSHKTELCFTIILSGLVRDADEIRADLVKTKENRVST